MASSCVTILLADKKTTVWRLPSVGRSRMQDVELLLKA